jgi:transcriptional regulator with XRE-family HTH domain
VASTGDTGDVDDNELGTLLRTWRDRVTPPAVGLPAGGPRRAPGLRREELAALAGLSVDYLTRLEQGRAEHPSAQVVGALSRALRLSQDEREHLFRIAGHATPDAGQMPTFLTPGIQRLLDRLVDVPVSVNDAAWNLLAWNPLWAALMGDPSVHTGRDRNVLWRYFSGSQGRIVRRPEAQAAFEQSVVADLQAAVGRWPEDRDLRALVSDLGRVSERFAELWAARHVAVHATERKTVDHPAVGQLTLDCDVLTVQGSDLRVVAYTAAPGSPDADRLALLNVLGLQAMISQPT